MSADAQHDHHVLGGHKATLNNPSSGEEAKERSKQILKEAGIDVKEVDGVNTFEEHKEPESKHDTRSDKTHSHEDHSSHAHSKKHEDQVKEKEEGGDQHDHRVLGGYKATLSNEHTSEEAKEHAREKLREAGEDY